MLRPWYNLRHIQCFNFDLRTCFHEFYILGNVKMLVGNKFRGAQKVEIIIMKIYVILGFNYEKFPVFFSHIYFFL